MNDQSNDPGSAPADGRLEQALGYIRNQRKQLEQLRNRVARLEGVLDYCLGDEKGIWLWRNRSERMDPNVPIYDPLRAAFHLSRYEFAAGFARERTVADIACGTGYGCQVLSEKGHANSVTGFDICPQTIEYARSRYQSEERQVQFKVAPAESINSPGKHFDLVTSFETIEHVESPETIFEEIARILKPDGIFICSTPNQWPLEIATHHRIVLDYNRFYQLLSSQFRIAAVYNQNSGTDWEFNHDQPAGHVLTTPSNQHLAECFIAVCEMA